MGIRKRGDSWEVNVAYRGSRKFATVKTSEADALAKEEELRAILILENRKVLGGGDSSDLAGGPTQVVSTPPPSWTLGHAIDITFEQHWNGTKSEWWYKLKCKVIEKHFTREALLSSLDTLAVDGFKNVLKEKGNGQATINHHLAALSMIFKIAHLRGGVAIKPVLGIKRSRRVRKRWVSEIEEKTQLALLRQWSKNDLVDWYMVLVDTGMRPEETKQMTGSWCDFRTTKNDKGEVICYGSIHVQVSKTDAGIRTIPMTKRVSEVLERRCLEYKHNPLFPYAWTVFTNQWDATRVAMKLTADRDFVAYCLRHTFGTRLIQRGVPVEVIQKLMGHSSIEQTMEYAKLGASQFVSAIATLEQETKK